MNIGLVGLGGMGTAHYHNYAHVQNARVSAAVGKTETDKARAAEWKLPLYETITQMCANEPIDLVDICVPTFLHRDLAVESLTLGKNTITEKPIALCLEDAKAMFDAAEQAGVQLYVAQVLQFARQTEILHEILKDRRFGKPLDACFERLSACPKWSQGSWLFDRSKSGLVPFDLHIHDLDVMISAFGKPKTMGFTCCGGEDKPYREQYRFTYGYDGMTVSAEAAWLNADIPFMARWRVYFERAMLIYDGGMLNAYTADGQTIVYDVEDPIKIPTGINVPPTGMFLRELEHFVQCASQNRPSERVPKEQVLAVLEVLKHMGV